MGSSPLLFPAGRIAMKILIVSGFLGAGKTTFIRHLTDTLPQVDFAIFENEIGGTDLDAKVLRDGDRSLNVYEMTENCVCCTGKADFLTNLMTILSALDPEVLIVEPTGAARLSALMGAIEGLQYDALELLPPLTLVDAGTFFREKDDFSELRLDQIRHGSVLVLSKSEQLSPGDGGLPPGTPGTGSGGGDHHRGLQKTVRRLVPEPAGKAGRTSPGARGS